MIWFSAVADWWPQAVHLIEDFHVWSTLAVLYVGTPVQVLFIVGYFTRKWRKYTFSRALMYKSGALALYLYQAWCKVLVAGLRGYDWPLWIDIQTGIINTLVLVAIVNQLRALIVDMANGDPDSSEHEVNDRTEKDAKEAREE